MRHYSFARFTGVAFLTSLAWVSPHVEAGMVTIGASQDTTIFQNNPANSLGGGMALFAGNDATSSPRRALLFFNLAGIPKGATINSVSLELVLAGVAGSRGGGKGGGKTNHPPTKPKSGGTSKGPGKGPGEPISGKITGEDGNNDPTKPKGPKPPPKPGKPKPPSNGGSKPKVLPGTNEPDKTPRQIGLFKLTDGWGEGTTGLGKGGLGGTGQGFPSVSPNTSNGSTATWSSRFYSAVGNPHNVPWLNAGGDFSSTASASTLVGTTVGQTYVWSSPQMVADVQLWLRNPNTNHGWLMKGDETHSTTFRQFWSKDANPQTQGSGPQLVVAFTPAAAPEPASVTLLSIGLVGLAGYGWRRRKT
jgi:hypothetical protein